MSIIASQSPATLRFIQPFVQADIKESIKARITGPLCGKPPGTGGVPSQRANNAESISMVRCRHVMRVKSNVGHFGVPRRYTNSYFECLILNMSVNHDMQNSCTIYIFLFSIWQHHPGVTTWTNMILSRSRYNSSHICLCHVISPMCVVFRLRYFYRMNTSLSINFVLMNVLIVNNGLPK